MNTFRDLPDKYQKLFHETQPVSLTQAEVDELVELDEMREVIGIPSWCDSDFEKLDNAGDIKSYARRTHMAAGLVANRYLRYSPSSGKAVYSFY